MPTAIVIGASSGIGLALCRRLIHAGYDVSGVARRPAALTHERYNHVIADVRDDSFGAALSHLATVAPDLCVYAAGIGDAVDVATMSGEVDTVRTNLVGLVATAEVMIPLMVSAKGGHFIGLSSQADRLIDGRAPSYSASKAGMSSYLEGLALATRTRGVAVTNVRFGFVDTAMAKSPMKPFMISADRAAELIIRCLDHRPIRYTYPRRLAVLVALAGLPARTRARFG